VEAAMAIDAINFPSFNPYTIYQTAMSDAMGSSDVETFSALSEAAYKVELSAALFEMTLDTYESIGNALLSMMNQSL
jgi:hypothetical protein